MDERKVFNKRTPNAGERHFIPIPSDARHYIYHEKMSADKFYLYVLIIDYYNPEEGRAFPSVETLALKYGKVPDTTSRHLDDLKEVGLIDFPEKGSYLPLVPLDEDTFFTRYPEAREKRRLQFQKFESRREASKNRMAQWRKAKGYDV